MNSKSLNIAKSSNSVENVKNMKNKENKEKKEYIITTVQTRDGLIIYHRKDTSDIKAIKEACANLRDEDDPSLPRKISSSYERVRAAPIFKLGKDEIWMDCGAQIGSFTLRALKNGAKCVISIEPEDTSASLFSKNIIENGFQDKNILERFAIVPDEGISHVTLHKTNSTYRHTLISSVKHTDKVIVPAITLTTLLKKYPDTTCVKLDIEGNEKTVLQSVDWKKTNVSKLVYEYSFDHHPVMDEFYDLIDYMKSHFKTVFYRPSVPKRGEIWNTKITRGANGWLVWCVK